MRRLATSLVGALVLLTPATALADTQPSQGVHSTGRNEAEFGGGPHCHVLIREGNHFKTIVVYPSHQGHDASGLTHIFAADPNCDGDAGL
jgi:hypothetical protein